MPLAAVGDKCGVVFHTGRPVASPGLPSPVLSPSRKAHIGAARPLCTHSTGLRHRPGHPCCVPTGSALGLCVTLSVLACPVVRGLLVQNSLIPKLVGDGNSVVRHSGGRNGKVGGESEGDSVSMPEAHTDGGNSIGSSWLRAVNTH